MVIATVAPANVEYYLYTGLQKIFLLSRLALSSNKVEASRVKTRLGHTFIQSEEDINRSSGHSIPMSLLLKMPRSTSKKDTVGCRRRRKLRIGFKRSDTSVIGGR
jgi:hypothetical protein